MGQDYELLVVEARRSPNKSPPCQWMSAPKCFIATPTTGNPKSSSSSSSSRSMSSSSTLGQMPAQHLIHRHYEARSLIEIDLTADKSLDISEHCSTTSNPMPVPMTTSMVAKDIIISPVMVVVTTPTNSTAANGSSPIANLKRLHGWITWRLIRMFTRGGEAVLDLACGKGGDLRKWDKAGACYYVGVDMVAGLLDAAHRRYLSLGCKFTALFVCGDAYSESLLEDITTTTTTNTTGPGSTMKNERASALFDMVSCQFALHYAWSSLERARAAMQNIAASLKPGGFFIGTIPDADAIVEKLRASAAAAMLPEYDEIDCCDPQYDDDNIFSCDDDDDDDDDGDHNCHNVATSALMDGVHDTKFVGGKVVNDDHDGPGSTNELITFGNRVYHITFTKEYCKRALDLYGRRPSPETNHPTNLGGGGGVPGMAAQAQPSSSSCDPLSRRWFGIEYEFFLADAVHECPEWLVPLSSLTSLARELGLHLIFASNFHRFLAEQRRHLHHPHHSTPDEWDCASIYLTFAFQKQTF